MDYASVYFPEAQLFLQHLHNLKFHYRYVRESDLKAIAGRVAYANSKEAYHLGSQQ
jgi:hypothetical protein